MANLTEAGNRLAPLIVTAELSGEILAIVEGLRRKHYPPERNRVKAHLTLFHAVPPTCRQELRETLADLAATHAPLPARLAGVIDLGNGTALKVISDALHHVHAAIADRFAGMLNAQDRQVPRFHITIQNKVDRHKARELQRELAGQPFDRPFAIAGLEAHFYRGGPWESAGRWRFRRGA